MIRVIDLIDLKVRGGADADRGVPNARQRPEPTALEWCIMCVWVVRAKKKSRKKNDQGREYLTKDGS